MKTIGHEAAKWLLPEELDSVDWLPADLGLIEKLKNFFGTLKANSHTAF